MSARISRNYRRVFLALVTVFCTVCLPAPAFSQSDAAIEFTAHGQPIRILSISDLANITPAVSLKVFEIHEKKDRVYKAYSAQAVFNSVFGEEWKKAEEAVFIALDGYQASIPLAKFRSHEAYFAFAHADGSPFSMTNTLQNNEVVQLGPLYLIWDNMNSKALREDGAADMPYQVKSVELTTFAARFPKLYPPAKSSEEAQRGFLYFRKYCMACHMINGEGGGKAPELNYPTSVVEYIKPEYLVRWIENPSSLRHNTLMPGLAQELPNRATITQEIIAYLKAMSTTK